MVRPLTLATPTVDIGYNFGRPGKQRQSLDRLVCDARYGDELTQRLGRVGRVLGRQETTQPSSAVAVLSDEAARELQSYDGQTLSRREWAAIVDGLSQLPPKHQLEGYIKSQAIIESFYPIYKISSLSTNGAEVAAELLAMVREVFAPKSSRKVGQLRSVFAKYEQRKRWLALPETQRWTSGEHRTLAQFYADYSQWLISTKDSTI